MQMIGNLRMVGAETSIETLTFEVFVQTGFSDLEVASITETLSVANRIKDAEVFRWYFVSDTPGLVKGVGGMRVSARPDVPDHEFGDWMIVVGSKRGHARPWLKRLRSMRREGRGVVLLSGAATDFINAGKITSGAVTTHWRDVAILRETGDFPNLTTRLSEKTAGVITSAGAGSTAELIIALLAANLNSVEVSELSNRLMLPSLRTNTTQQPKTVSTAPNIFESRMSKVIQMMETTLDEPVPINELARLARLSTRQLERKFSSILQTSPYQFYKRLRVKRARLYLDETQMSLSKIAAATGFGSTNALSKAIRFEYGTSPKQLRRRAAIRMLEYSKGHDSACE